MAGSSNSTRRFIICTEQESGFPVGWEILPDPLIDALSDKLCNVSALKEGGGIIERTVVYLRPSTLKEFNSEGDGLETYEFSPGIVIGVRKEGTDE